MKRKLKFFWEIGRQVSARWESENQSLALFVKMVSMVLTHSSLLVLVELLV